MNEERTKSFQDSLFTALNLFNSHEWYEAHDAFEEIKNICINIQKDTDASNLEVKSLLKLIMNEWEEREEQKNGFGFR